MTPNMLPELGAVKGPNQMTKVSLQQNSLTIFCFDLA